MKGAQTPRLGLRSTPAQPVPSDSKYLAILNLREVDQRPGPSGGRASPHLAPGALFIFTASPHPGSRPPCPQEGRLSRESQLLMWFPLLQVIAKAAAEGWFS